MRQAATRQLRCSRVTSVLRRYGAPSGRPTLWLRRPDGRRNRRRLAGPRAERGDNEPAAHRGRGWHTLW